MKKVTRSSFLISALGAIVALVSATAFASVPDGGTRLKTNLTGAAIGKVTPKGAAKFASKVEHGKAEAELEVEVQKVNMADGSVLQVVVQGGSVGSIKLAHSRGKLELRTEAGDTVPAVQKGDVITVVNAAGAVILSGTF